MSHLNYFEPYQSLKPHHEDQLTRAFLVLLKFSPAVFFRFYSYCIGSVQQLAEKEGQRLSLPGLHELDVNDLELLTQISRYTVNSDRVVSVLITDNSFHVPIGLEAIKASERAARYDGIIRIGNDITFLIENKPDARNVWRGQLDPSVDNLPENADEHTLVKIPAILEWRQIIEHVSELLDVEVLSGMEKMLIADFLDFLDRHHVTLNPYRRFSQCKNSRPLLLRRIEHVLESKFGNERTGYHRGWAHYVMAGFPEVKQIGVRLEYNDNEPERWQIELSMYFGDIMQQARDFYRQKDLDTGYLEELRSKGWQVLTNPHISMQSKNWIFFRTPEHVPVEQYIRYWQDHVGELEQYNKADLLGRQLEYWAAREVIVMEETDKSMVVEKLKNVQPTTRFNWCPGIRILLFIPASEALALDENGTFEEILVGLINEGLGLIGKNLSF